MKQERAPSPVQRTMEIAPPYLLFLGSAKDSLEIKTAAGLIAWRRELCLGQLRLQDCIADAGLPDMTISQAATAGARSMVIGTVSAGGVLPPEWFAPIEAALDAGMDVVYTGLHRTPAEVVQAAVQEDVDILGVSLLSGAHMTIIPEILKQLKDAGAADIRVVAGGVMPDDDVVELKKLGVAEVLLQDTPPDEIVSMLRHVAAGRGR